VRGVANHSSKIRLVSQLQEHTMNDQLPSPLDHWDNTTPVWTPFRSAPQSR
jgi:hypothetical protein